MEITYDLIKPILLSENWDENKVLLCVQASNQEFPIEVLGFMKTDSKEDIDSTELNKQGTEFAEDIRQETTLNTFKTILCYYEYQNNEWVYTLVKQNN